MDISEIIADLERQVADAERAAAELPALRKHLETAREIAARYGVKAAPPAAEPSEGPEGEASDHDVYPLFPPASGPGSNGTGDWATINRHEAVERILRASDKPLSPSEINATLRRHGRGSERINVVSAVLSNLRRKGRARQVEYGKWAALSEEGGGGE